MAEEHDVRVGQLHGMSQRGGSVQATVLIGPGHSSFIGRGRADAVLALEPLELGRATAAMSAHTRALVSVGPVVPFHLAMKGEPYPSLDALFARVRERCSELVTIDATALAQQAGSPRSVNVVMLGALGAAGILPLGAASLLAAIERRSPPQLIEATRRAFALGERAAQR